MNAKTTNNILVLMLGLTLAFISILCEVLFFTDFADTLTDKVIAGVTALALVGCQFVFLGASVLMTKEGKEKTAIALRLAMLCLLVLSIAATASFFESRYVSQTNKNTQNSDGYKLQKQLIDDLGQQDKALRDAAIAANNKNNSWYAGTLLKKADEANEKRQHLIKTLKSTQPTTATSGEALAAFAGGLRWALWLVMASLVDVCALLCFAAISYSPATQKASNKKQATQKQAENIKPVLTMNADEMKAAIIQEITAGHYGSEPKVREVMKAHSKAHGFVKDIFEHLLDAGILSRPDNARIFHLVANHET